VKCDLAIVCADDPMRAVVEATKYRRHGVSVYTQFSGKRKSQLRRAFANAEQVIELGNQFVQPTLDEILA